MQRALAHILPRLMLWMSSRFPHVLIGYFQALFLQLHTFRRWPPNSGMHEKSHGIEVTDMRTYAHDRGHPLSPQVRASMMSAHWSMGVYVTLGSCRRNRSASTFVLVGECEWLLPQSLQNGFFQCKSDSDSMDNVYEIFSMLTVSHSLSWCRAPPPRNPSPPPPVGAHCQHHLCAVTKGTLSVQCIYRDQMYTRPDAIQSTYPFTLLKCMFFSGEFLMCQHVWR